MPRIKKTSRNRKRADTHRTQEMREPRVHPEQTIPETFGPGHAPNEDYVLATRSHLVEEQNQWIAKMVARGATMDKIKEAYRRAEELVEEDTPTKFADSHKIYMKDLALYGRMSEEERIFYRATRIIYEETPQQDISGYRYSYSDLHYGDDDVRDFPFGHGAGSGGPRDSYRRRGHDK